MSAMWIESSFDVAGRHVRVSVKRLDDHEGERFAAEVAWFAQSLLTPDADFEPAGWTILLQRILSEHIAITVDEDALDTLDEIVDQLVYRAFVAFMQANKLDPLFALSVETSRAWVTLDKTVTPARSAEDTAAALNELNVADRGSAPLKVECKPRNHFISCLLLSFSG